MRRGTEFSAAIRGGARGGSQRLIVHLRAPEDGSDTSSHDGAVRVGLIVPRAVGPAVQRNRVKRRLRALIADRLAQFEPANQLVVRALPAAGRATSAELGQDLEVALRKAQQRRQRSGRRV